MPSNLEIAQATSMEPIKSIASKYGIIDDELELYGNYKAKISLSLLDRLGDRPDGKLILVTGITPTPFGEGKTCTTIGLTQALAKLEKKSLATLRQPSTGPVFGIKGGATGGGFSQVLPMEDINLGLTGDFHAVTTAHNLLAALLDNHITKGNKLNIDINNVFLQRVMDMNDRALRKIVIGLGGKANGIPRESGFDITAASEVMAILALAANLKDLKERCGRITVALSNAGKFITAKDLEAAGAMATILKDAIKPNLVQTTEHLGVLIHAGPFANIAHGCNSVIADKIALKLAEYVITESGFGSDLGGEKFIDIKCRQSGLQPAAIVLVVSIRALKMHGGAFKATPGQQLDKEAEKENVPAVEKGSENMVAHIENLKQFGVPVIVAVNKFPADTMAEIETVEKIAREYDVPAVLSEVVAKGGDGGIALAEEVLHAIDTQTNKFTFLYPDDMKIVDKMETIAKKVYGADAVIINAAVQDKIKKFEELGLGKLPVCMAKTHLSLTDNPNVKGRPKGFKITVDDIRPSTGAGFLYPILGSMMTMPGLSERPAAVIIDIDENGKITGLN